MARASTRWRGWRTSLTDDLAEGTPKTCKRCKRSFRAKRPEHRFCYRCYREKARK